MKKLKMKSALFFVITKENAWNGRSAALRGRRARLHHLWDKLISCQGYWSQNVCLPSPNSFPRLSAHSFGPSLRRWRVLGPFCRKNRFPRCLQKWSNFERYYKNIPLSDGAVEGSQGGSCEGFPLTGPFRLVAPTFKDHQKWFKSLPKIEPRAPQNRIWSVRFSLRRLGPQTL